MMKKLLALLLLALLLFSCAQAEQADPILDAAKTVLSTDEALKKQSIKSKYKSWDELGAGNEILAIYKGEAGYAFHVRVDYGADFYENPSLELVVGVGADGTYKGVIKAASVDHTPQFLDMVDDAYIASAYIGKTVSPSFMADAVSGATFSSDAVLFGMRLCGRYASSVYRLGDKDDVDVQIKKLMSVVPGSYEKAAVNASFASDAGEIQYAAKGTTADGRNVAALVVKAAFTPADPLNDMSMPTYQIFIDTDANKVFMASMLAGRFYEGFAMDDARLAAYYDVEIAGADAFDSFDGGLIVDAPEFILTSASQAFPDTTTGATPEGNDTSRSVKNCFVAAAQYYCGFLK